MILHAKRGGLLGGNTDEAHQSGLRALWKVNSPGQNHLNHHSFHIWLVPFADHLAPAMLLRAGSSPPLRVGPTSEAAPRGCTR